MLPLPVKFLIALGISIIFIVITQWERLGLATQWDRLTVKQHTIIATSTLSNSPPHSEQRSLDASPPAPTHAEETEASRLERMGRITITDPRAQFNGSIIGNGQTFYLYGIKHFDSKQVCILKSGARWACGLRAYAALRNATAKKILICDPKKILRNALSAVCHVGAADVALALVRNGLVELDDDVEDTEMLQAQAIAKRQNLGVWDRQN